MTVGFAPGHSSSFQVWAHLRLCLDFDRSIGQEIFLKQSIGQEIRKYLHDSLYYLGLNIYKYTNFLL